jgi:hypothetical protein
LVCLRMVVMGILLSVQQSSATSSCLESERNGRVTDEVSNVDVAVGRQFELLIWNSGSP